METTAVNGIELKKMLVSAHKVLEKRFREVDALNVFPVPDGDTGTNMYLTLGAAVESLSWVQNLDSVGEVSEAASKGSLMGARGNSGVILSQFLRGLAQGLKGMEQVSVEVFAVALEQGVKLAYQAVIKPVEGTILTVAKEAAIEAVRAARQKNDLPQVLERAAISADETLKRTPDMLPVLKEAGVVDAGGMGWLVILQGFKAGITGLILDEQPSVTSFAPGENDSEVNGVDFIFPYCTELLIKSGDVETDPLREQLENLGDSLMIVQTDGFLRVHVHSDHPGLILEQCLKYGALAKVSVANMVEQAAAAAIDLIPVRERKPFAIVSVALGDGIQRIMQSLGADLVVQGGQTMNPSTRELLTAVEELNAETVILLPNNSNILLTARQVSELTDAAVTVVESLTIPQGIAALLSIIPGMDKDKMIAAMQQAVMEIRTGEVTYAARDSIANGMQINSGDIIGIADNDIVASGNEINEVTVNLVAKMGAGSGDICSVYYGQDISNHDADELLTILEQKYPELEFELNYGGQPFYYYIISIE